MEYLLLKIVLLLRASGISIGVGEITDCIQLLKLRESDTMNKYDFYRLINTTMIKTSWGEDYILWLVELYFGPDLEINGDQIGFLKNITSGFAKNDEFNGTSSVPQLAEAVIKNDFKYIYLTFRGLHLGLEPGIEGWEEAVSIFQRECGWLEVSNLIRQAYLDEQLNDEDYTSSLKLLENWNVLIEVEVEHQLARNMTTNNLLKELKKRNPKTEAFIDCNDDHMELITREILKLGKKLATRKSRRLEVGRGRTICLSRTIRKSLKTAGVPVKLIKMRKKNQKPDIWLICDISNSVRKFIYFMMMLVYAAQQSYKHIRSFLFVDNLVESTEYFQKNDWKSSLFNLKLTKNANFTGFSDYGKVLQQFSRQYLPHLTKKTTVLILGDGKNNRHQYNGCEILSEITAKASALYWLNPFPRDAWGQKDCEMRRYEKYCSGVYPCSNIEELERFLNSI